MDIAAYRCYNEHAVNIYKKSGMLQRGLREHGGTERLAGV